jgi:purine-nucleoside phosphorylase
MQTGKIMSKINKNIIAEIEEAVSFLRSQTQIVPEVAIIMGTGLGQLKNAIEIETEIDYKEIPHFPESTVESHAGKLIFGTVEGKNVVAMQGRFHYYEGYSMQQITFPVRVMKFLGADKIIISNACGCLNPQWKKGRIMLIEDHINLLGDNPLIGINDERLGPRFVDMCEPYSKRMISIAEKAALQNSIPLYKGVYAAMSGPSLETRAEYRFLRTIGVDVIGMSTVPENIVAVQMGMEVLGLSVMTDECLPDALKPVDIKEILEFAAVAEPDLVKLTKAVIKEM